MFHSRFSLVLVSLLALSAVTTSAEAMDLLQRGRSLLDSATKKPSGDSGAAALSVGAIQAYDRTMARYKSIPLVPDVKADLTNHVLDGIFLYLAREEAAIREQPVKRTTDILKKVFGAAS